jgi:hypothetical protein
MFQNDKKHYKTEVSGEHISAMLSNEIEKVAYVILGHTRCNSRELKNISM